VPVSALQNSQNGQHVFVVKDDKTAEFRAVTIERTLDNDAVIAKGLSVGETVVTDGQLRVVPGGAVDIRQPDGSAGAGGRERGGSRRTCRIPRRSGSKTPPTIRSSSWR